MVDEDILEKKESLNRIIRVCKGINAFIKFVFAVFCVCWLLAAVFMLTAIPEKGVESVIGGVVLHMARGVVIAIIFIQLLGLFSNATNGESPFTMKQTGRLRKISYALIIYGVLELLLSGYSTVVDYGGFSSGYISTGETPIVSFNFAPFIAAAVVYAFSFVFKYGVLLQEFSDETL